MHRGREAETAVERADANHRTNDTMARDAPSFLPSFLSIVVLRILGLSIRHADNRATRVFLAKIRREWKSAGKENNRKERERG